MATVIKLIIFYILITTNVLGSQLNITRKIEHGIYNISQQFRINNTIEYIIEYSGNTDKFPVRVTVSSPSSTKEKPLLVVAQQKKHITSWQLPYIANPLKEAVEYSVAGHILCPASSFMYRTMSTAAITPRVLGPSGASNPVVIVKSPGGDTHDFTITAQMQTDFFIKNKQVYTSEVTASQPIYYFYNFRDLENQAKDSAGVLVQVNSDSRDCMIISVQNSTCPVFDLENNIKFDSYWQTMNNKAGIVVSKKEYPDGFYIVMVVKQDDKECNEIPIMTSNKIKIVNVTVTDTLTRREHFLIAISTIAIFAGIFVICTVIGMVYLIKNIQREKNEASVDVTDAGVSLTNGHESNRWRQLFRASSRSKKSTNYVWHVGIVALFYAIPVLQLVITYQGILHVTGNEDLCYYNFLCAHPLGYITDFNHVFSNIGYIFLGLLFTIITYVKELLERSTLTDMYGLPKPYGMYYALGFALIMEGVMSACYHICPKSSNFQFDTSFMYVMTVLMIVNVYENRHSTGDKRGYAVFGILAVATTLSTLALLIGTKLYFWIIFGIIQISLCLGLTWALDKSLFKMMWTAEERQKITRVHICRIVLWIIGNVINWLVVAYGIYERSGFSTYLLMVLIINGLFYTIYYISMKICYNERILAVTWVFIVLATLFWGVAMYFFVTNVTSWEKSPAESRNLNQECALVKYYDSHDVWHFLSSIALFFTFIVLLTLDEGLSQTPRADITDFHTH